MTIYKFRVEAKLGYYSFYDIESDDLDNAKIDAQHRFKQDTGCKEVYPETYCFNPHQKYMDDHAGEPIVTVD